MESYTLINKSSKKFLFVTPKYAEYGKTYNFPIGLAYVASNMEKHGFNTFCLNLCHHNDPIEKILTDFISKNQIDVLCTGGMSLYWAEIEQVLKITKRINLDIITVVGGAIVTSTPKLAMENLLIDYGVIGEGEEIMVELAKAICENQDTLSTIHGLIYYDKTKNIVLTSPKKAIADLDSLPFPAYEGFGFDKWLKLPTLRPASNGLLFDIFESKIVEMIASRSCPFSCTFCYHPLGNKYRQRSVDNIAKEIHYLKEKYDINIVRFFDELFSINEERVYEIIKILKKYNLKWDAQWRVNNINREILVRLKESGMYQLGLGVESLSDKILKSMNKKISKAQIEEALKLCYEIGVRTGSNLIFGDPAETEETAKESLDWYFKHPESNLNLHMIVAVPNAPLYKYAVEKKIIKDELAHIKNKFPIVNLTSMSDKEFNKLKNKIIYRTYMMPTQMVGQVLFSRKESEIHNGKNIYTFKIKCPDCGKISRYRHTPYSLRYYCPIICKNCCKNIKVKNSKVFYDEHSSIFYFTLHSGEVFYHLYLARFKFFRITIFNALRKILQRF